MSVSVIIPCLNEEDSIEECISRVRKAFEAEQELEVLVVDNGSTDRSRELATQAGARVIDERRRGYGSAILRGMFEAEGDYLVMGDADNTYDFEDSVPLVEELKEGAEFAIGNRLTGRQEKGAMPWAHRHIGTPVLTAVLNWFYGSRVKDINCGLRAIRKDALPKLRLRSPGMEFASEMVIHAQKAGLKIAEQPIRYYRRKAGEAKLRTFRDGWRHLRFILLFAPFHVFIIPAFLLSLASIALYTSERFGDQVVASLLMITATQIVIFGLIAKAYLWTVDAFVVDRGFGRLVDRFRLEHGILVSLGCGLFGGLLGLQLDLANLIRGVTLLSVGVQFFFSSFIMSIILFKRDNERRIG